MVMRVMWGWMLPYEANQRSSKNVLNVCYGIYTEV